MPGLLTRGFCRIERILPMRWCGTMSRLSTRLTLAMVLIVMVTALAVGFVNYRGIDLAELLAGLGAVVGAVILAIMIARSLTRPLRQMTAAVQAFGRNEPMQLPANAAGEIGVLVQAFEQLVGEIKSRSIALAGYAKSETLYAAAVHSSNLAFLTTDRGGLITGWNPGAERLFGYSAEEAIGRDTEMLVPPERRDEIPMIREKLRTGQRIDNMSTERLAKGGRPIHVVFDISPLRTPTNELVGSSAIVRDVTEQRLAEDLFKLAVEACPSGMMMIDRSGHIVMVNSETEHLFGYSREELISRPVEMLVPPHLRTGHAKMRSIYNKHSEIHSMGKGRELVGLHRDGSEFPVEIELNPIHIRDGLLVLAVIVDISERRRNDRLKDEFVSTVSHELRTPLTSITASLALLQAGGVGRLPEPAARLVGIAHNNGQRLVRLINDILDVEKIESGKMSFHLEQVNVAAVVEQAIEASRAHAEELGVTVRLDPDSVAGKVPADADRLAQVVGNLLSNAIKFSPRGEDVIVCISERDETIRITVRDHGPGIPDEFKPHVFEKFAQADSGDKRQKGGTGLGLSIVDEIVKRLSGEVGFESEVGGGTLFFVELPRWRADDEAASGLSVLLCEDDADVAGWLAARLTKSGFRVDVVPSMREALQRADGGVHAAVLVDFKLPDGDGIGLIQQLRGRPGYRDTPVVVVAAHSARGVDDARAAALDVLDWRDKPVDFERLLRALNQPMTADAGGRPRILHVDEDDKQRTAVAEAMRRRAQVVSVRSLEEARDALAKKPFDLAVLDMTLLAGGGPELLTELRGGDGRPVPVVLLSAHGNDAAYAERVRRALAESSNTPDELIAALTRRFKATPAAGENDDQEVA